MSKRKSKRKPQTTTSDGLRDLLIRHGIAPTMDRNTDIELARQIMPKVKK